MRYNRIINAIKDIFNLITFNPRISFSDPRDYRERGKRRRGTQSTFRNHEDSFHLFHFERNNLYTSISPAVSRSERETRIVDREELPTSSATRFACNFSPTRRSNWLQIQNPIDYEQAEGN